MTADKYWQPGKETETPLEWLRLDDPQGWWDAIVKEDGCIDLTRYHNFPKGSENQNEGDVIDTLHICDLDEFIARLQAMREIALASFYEWRHRLGE